MDDASTTYGRSHRAEIRDELGVMGIGLRAEFGIGQRALLVESPGGNVLWDCVPLLDEDGVVPSSRAAACARSRSPIRTTTRR